MNPSFAASRPERASPLYAASSWQSRGNVLACGLTLAFALLLGIVPERAVADMRCCMAEPKILPDGTFKYTGIPFRLTRPAFPIQGFTPLTPSSPRQPDAPNLAPPAPIAMPQGPRSDFSASSLQSPAPPSR